MTNEKLTQKFVFTEDTPSLEKKLFRALNRNLPQSRDGVDQYFSETEQTLGNACLAISPEIKIQTFREEQIERDLSIETNNFLQANPSNLCLCLDRFLLGRFEEDKKLNNRFFRLQICRSITGERVPRQSSPTLNRQIELLKQKFPDINRQKILIVDDGVFSGGTINSVLSLLSTIGIFNSQINVLGFIGNDTKNTLKDLGIDTQTINNYSKDSLFDWGDQRDISIFAGRLKNSNQDNSLTWSIPYLPPWNNGQDLSLNKSPLLFQASLQIINSQIGLLSFWEKQIEKRLTFTDSVKAGFPLPINIDGTIPVSRQDGMIDYLKICQMLIKKQGDSK